MKKRVMLLGGNYYQMTATRAAKELGCYTISVDYLPDNPAHKLADEYHNVSTTDREAVLALAEKLSIDGIVSYASDVSAPTAAYVAEKLGLPGNPLSAVEILTHKDQMRAFMHKHGFLTPQGEGFTREEAAREFFAEIRKPAMVKPVDSSGSKGISKISDIAEFPKAWEAAKHYSMSGTVIVEEFVQRDKYQIAGDGFLIDGRLAFAGLMDEHFDRLCNPLVPIGESYPSTLPEEKCKEARAEIQRLLSLLNMRTGAINLDFMLDTEGSIRILEIGPRNGGNLITDAIRYGSGVDLARYTILAAVGESCDSLKEQPVHTLCSSYVIHALEDGIYQGLWISDEIKNDIVRLDMFVRPGDPVHRFDNGGFGIGAAIIRFHSQDEMLGRMDHMERYMRVNLISDKGAAEMNKSAPPPPLDKFTKRVAILQSNYIPWKGYFDIINMVDEFILYDDMQYTRRDWRNRNMIVMNGRLQWLTIPVESKGRFTQKIKDTKVSDHVWAEKHWKSLECAYAKTPGFHEYAPQIQRAYEECAQETCLSMINFRFLTEICNMLHISTKITWSWDYTLADGKTERLVKLVQDVGGDYYLSGPAAKSYIDTHMFQDAGIALDWMDYNGYPPYRQNTAEFTHNVSILDLLFNEGSAAKMYMKSF